jgi:hypothetical protein
MNKTRLKCFNKKITIKKHLIKITIIIITFTLVSYNKVLFLNKQPPQPEQPTFIARQSDIPANPFALNRLAKQTVVEIVSEGYLTGGDKYIPKGSGVIIGRKDSVYYVLTANHISNIDDGLLVFIRSEKPGAAGEVLPLKFIKRYPQEDLAVVTFLSFTDYRVAEVGEASQLDDDNQVYVAGWPGAENREGFQFTPAKVTNPQVGDNLTYQPTEPGEDVYKGMSGGAVLNEAGQLVGIHVGLTKIDGDGKGVLISTFLQMVPPEVEEVLGRSTPDVLSSSSSENEGVELQLPSKEEKVSMEDENEIGVELPEQLDKERRKREEIEQRVQEIEVERNKQKNLERQLEKEKRQREKAERREQELEAEQQREQTKIQREQCKQRRSQKENQKKSELELEQKEKREKLLVSWHVAFLVCLVYLVVFSGLQVCKKYLTEELTAILEWNERNWLLSFLVLFGYLFMAMVLGFIYSLTLAVESRIEYHEWINCYDAYPPTPFLFRLF